MVVQREPDLLLVRPDWKLEYMIAAESGKRLLNLQKSSAETENGPEEEESESPPHVRNPDGATGSDTGEDAESDGVEEK